MIPNIEFVVKSSDPCPCGRGKELWQCCLQLDGSIRRDVGRLTPASPRTGYSHPKCYLNHSCDCSSAISKEHYISKALLGLIGETFFFTFPWSKEGAPTKVGINTLVAKVLCSRHNNALSPLDDHAAEFFSALRGGLVHATKETLSKKPYFRVVSGAALELWVAKVLFGLFHAKLLAGEGQTLEKTHTVDAALFYDALERGEMLEPCGLYITPETLGSREGPLDCTPLGRGARLVGMRARLLPLSLDVIFDPYRITEELLTWRFYSPPSLNIKGRKRTAHLVFTWAQRATRKSPDLLTALKPGAKIPERFLK